ncbi:hypothetical protein AB0O82_03970 [Kitasatospora sp. NPDC088264]|uniref:hypothetical protein n=1 Tax=Kitasatospora sp. NPDC088264 TaxID=3155296 RepID=UPI003421AF81
MTALNQQQPADEGPDVEPKNAGRPHRDGVRRLLAVWRGVKMAYEIWQLFQDLWN